MRKSPIRIGLVQMSMETDRAANFDKAVGMAWRAREAGAEIIALPELFAGRYFAQHERRDDFALAEPIPGPGTWALSALAKSLGAVLIGSLFERVQPGLAFNTAVVFERDGSLLGRSRTAHIPDFPCYYEKYYFAPGDDEYPVFHTSAGRIAVPGCWDQWFPEVARIAFLKGAEVVVYPSAIGVCRGAGREWLGAWQTVMRGHAVANGLYVAAVNRVGREEEMEFWGHSFLADPRGEMVIEGGDGEKVVVGSIDPALMDEARTVNQFLRDRRPETYGPLLKRWIGDEVPGR
jgi:N-carbamoylputrescine amidase